MHAVTYINTREIAIKGKGELPLNITEASSDIQENVLRKVDTTLEAEGTWNHMGMTAASALTEVFPLLIFMVEVGSTCIQQGQSLRRADGGSGGGGGGRGGCRQLEGLTGKNAGVLALPMMIHGEVEDAMVK